MARYNQKAVIEFLLTLEFNSVTEWAYAKNAKVAKEFGCTQSTAGKWIMRAVNSGLIEFNETKYSLVNQEKKRENERLADAMDNAVKYGKVVRMSSFKIKQRRAKEAV